LARTVNDQPKEGLGCVSKGCLILVAVCFALVLIFGGGGKTEVLRRLETETYCRASVRIDGARQGMAQLRGISRATQNALSHHQDKHDPCRRRLTLVCGDT